MPVPPRQPSRENMEALFNNAFSSTLASRRGGGGGDQHPETTTTTSGDVIQLEPNTNREITFRVWCHGSCARFTCASTLDEEHLPPTCPACGESEFAPAESTSKHTAWRAREICAAEAESTAAHSFPKPSCKARGCSMRHVQCHRSISRRRPTSYVCAFLDVFVLLPLHAQRWVASK